MPRKKGSTDYLKEVKQEAIRMRLEEGMTYREITESLRIRDPNRVKNWVYEYRRDGGAVSGKKRGRKRKVENEQSELVRLRMEVALLKKYQAELQELWHARRNIEPFSPFTRSMK